MPTERFEKGLAARKAVLGEEYVEANLAQADDFNREFQEVVTEFCWGFGWADDTLSRRDRSLINLGMIAALGRMHEWEVHFRGAMTFERLPNQAQKDAQIQCLGISLTRCRQGLN